MAKTKSKSKSKLYGRRVSGKKGSCDKKVIDREMKLWKQGKLYSGTGVKVKKDQHRQAIAIALNVARKKCRGPRGRPQEKGRRRSAKKSKSKH